jgi:hypothetical protein
MTASRFGATYGKMKIIEILDAFDSPDCARPGSVYGIPMRVPLAGRPAGSTSSRAQRGKNRVDDSIDKTCDLLVISVGFVACVIKSSQERVVHARSDECPGCAFNWG